MVSLGASLGWQEKYKEAEEICKKALIINPNNKEALINLGICLEHQIRYKEAEEIFRKILKTDPNNENALFHLGVALGEQKKHKEAEDVFKKVLKIDPNDEIALSNLGVNLGFQRKNKKAEEIFRKVLKINPNNKKALFKLETCLIAQKKYKETLKINPNNQKALYYLGNNLFIKEKYKEAEIHLKKALDINPQDICVLNCLGEVYLELNKYKDAKTTFNKILNSHANNHLIRERKRAINYLVKIKKIEDYDKRKNKHNVNIIKVKSFKEYLEVVDKLKTKNNNIVFRGQRHSFYHLLPSVLRDDKLKNLEEDFFRDFSLKANGYFQDEIEHFSATDILCLMQHYGVPTRLLDFTESALTALYFAIKDTDKEYEMFSPCVWVLDYSKLDQGAELCCSEEVRATIEEKLTDKITPPETKHQILKNNFVFAPKLKNKRLTIQKGLFFYFAEEKNLEENTPKDALFKIVFNSANGIDFLKSLENIGFTPTSIYPDFAGLAKEIQDNSRKFKRSELKIKDKHSKYEYFLNKLNYISKKIDLDK